MFCELGTGAGIGDVEGVDELGRGQGQGGFFRLAWPDAWVRTALKAGCLARVVAPEGTSAAWGRRGGPGSRRPGSGFESGAVAPVVVWTVPVTAIASQLSG